MGSVAESYVRKGFLIFEEMRKYLVIFEEPVSHIYYIVNRSRGNFILFFNSACTANRSAKIQEAFILFSGYGLESLKKGLRRWVAQYHGKISSRIEL